MKRILIAGSEDEISNLYNLLLWQEGRQFFKAETVEQCFELARRTDPDLIIIDSGISDLDVCHDLVVDLRRCKGFKRKPILLIAEPQKNNGAFARLLDQVDGVLPLSLDADEAKLQASEYL